MAEQHPMRATDRALTDAERERQQLGRMLMKDHCCEHDADAHDGAGCLDCSCHLGPLHVGYNPAPSTTDAQEATPPMTRLDFIPEARILAPAIEARGKHIGAGIRDGLVSIAEAIRASAPTTSEEDQ